MRATFQPPAAPATRQRDVASRAHLTFEVAQTEAQVRSACRLLYNVYRRSAFIEPNLYRLHAAPEAVGSHATVILGRTGGETVSTISSVGDSELGLPLDSVYHDELNHLRGRGRRLVEIGLFADRREGNRRSSLAAMELIRYAYWFGRYIGATDYICGIPPRRVRMYRNAFGFQPVGPLKRYACLTDNPVQLMHVDAAHIRRHHESYRGINYFETNPMAPDIFDSRFRFDAPSMARSPIQRYLNRKTDSSNSPQRQAS